MMLAIDVHSWQDDGVAVTTAYDDQYQLEMAPDGQGGAIICWTDERAGVSDKNIYAQRIDAQGNILWPSTDVAICTLTGSDQSSPRIIADGNGGAIIAWVDERIDTGDIYAQKVDSAGTVQWATNGVTVCAASSTQDEVQLVSDGNGGAIIAWEDLRNGATPDIYIQHCQSSDGASLWVQQVAGGPISKFLGAMLSDNADGAYLIIQNNTANNINLLFQHVDSTGIAQMPGNGTEILDLDLYLSWVQAVHSSDNQIIVIGASKLTDTDIWATKIDGSAAKQWGPDGISVCDADDWQEQPDVVSTSTGGAFIVWTDSRDGLSDIYLQIISSTGIVSADNGTALIDAPNSRAVHPHICEDGEGGAFLVWEDNRTSSSPGQFDIYYHHFDNTGTLDATLGTGTILCDATFHQDLTDMQDCIIRNGMRGAIVVWSDYRGDGATQDIYAGVIGECPSDGEIPSYSLALILPTLAIAVLLLRKRQLKDLP